MLNSEPDTLEIHLPGVCRLPPDISARLRHVSKVILIDSSLDLEQFGHFKTFVIKNSPYYEHVGLNSDSVTLEGLVKLKSVTLTSPDLQYPDLWMSGCPAVETIDTCNLVTLTGSTPKLRDIRASTLVVRSASCLPHWQSLKFLVLVHVDVASLSDFGNVQRLSVSWCANLRSVDASNLKIFDVYDCRLFCEIPNLTASSITELRLSGCLGIGELPELPQNLQILYLRNLPLARLPAQPLSLLALCLVQINRIETIGPPSPNLVQLDIEDCPRLVLKRQYYFQLPVNHGRGERSLFTGDGGYKYGKEKLSRAAVKKVVTGFCCFICKGGHRLPDTVLAYIFRNFLFDDVA